MSKKLITVLVTVFTVMILTTGCNSDKKAVTETVEGFLNAMVANDMEKASQYATEEFMESNTMKLMQPDYLADTFYATMNIDKEARITLGYNPDASTSVSDDTTDLVNEYQTEHYDELVAIFTEEGEKAMNKKIYNDLIPIVIGKMQEVLESSEPSEEKTILSLVKKDGVWLVTDLDENRPGAAAGDTAAEAAAGNTAEAAATGGTAVEEAAAEAATQEETAK